MSNYIKYLSLKYTKISKTYIKKIKSYLSKMSIFFKIQKFISFNSAIQMVSIFF